MYRGFHSFVRMLLKYLLSLLITAREKLLRNEEETLDVASVWKSALSYKSSTPWGTWVAEPEGMDALREDILLRPFFDDYSSSYQRYLSNHNLLESSCLSEEVYLVAEESPQYSGLFAIVERAHNQKEVRIATAESLTNAILASEPVAASPIETSSSSKYETSLFIEMYKSILTYLPTAIPDDYTALDTLRSVLLKGTTELCVYSQTRLVHRFVT